MSEVILKRVSKSYGEHVAVDNVDLTIREGEFVTLLGPSGCGKTTTLRIVAGFVEPSSGEVLIGGQLVTRLPANKRNTGMVFQSFALFPHLTVTQNIAFGLQIRKLSSVEIDRRVKEALALVHLSNFGDRLPRALSGGQQQRVALARAVVIRPQVLLLDEPLSALDLKLRHELQIYIKEVQKALKITTIYVTHDQGEALRLSDRIAVMRNGRVEQIDPPLELYRSPKTSFVAKFVGEMNFLPVNVVRVEGGVAHCRLTNGNETDDLLGATLRSDSPRPAPGMQMLLGFRPETTSLGMVEGNSIQGVVTKVDYQGSTWSITMRIADDTSLELELPSGFHPPEVGKAEFAYWSINECFLLPNEA